MTEAYSRKQVRIVLLLSILSVLCYWLFAYELVRTDSIQLIGLYGALFILFYKLVQLGRHNTKALTWLAFGFRAVFLLSIPNLSQDFYRFIWDGRLLFEGFNPYLYTPDAFMSIAQIPVNQAQELYNGMGSLSAGHFSNYPPLNQLCFYIAALFSGNSILGSIMTLRILIILADFGTLYFGKRLLERFNVPSYHIFWYVLNPFIIIELTGNLHFEGVMIFFLIWSLYVLHCGRWKLSAVLLALSVSVKLIPLIFLPLFYHYFKQLKSTKPTKNFFYFITYSGIVLGVTLMLFVPFLSVAFVTNYAATVGLWFQTFEFNASLYYLFREIGYWMTGYNQIAMIGKIVPVLVVLFVLYLTFFKKAETMPKMIALWVLALSIYLFTATTVHPWYLATLLALSVFTQYKFPIVWSLMVVLSYVAYSHPEFKEHPAILILEYAVVYGFFIWEVGFRKKHQSLFN